MGFFNFIKEQDHLKQIDISEDPDFVDLQLTITKYWQDEDKNHICQVKGLWNKDTIGFEIAFRPDLQLGIIDGEVDKTRFYKEGRNSGLFLVRPAWAITGQAEFLEIY